MSGPQIIDCEQGTPEWFAARLGVPTASMFSAVMAKGQGKTRATYMRKLAGEVLTGSPASDYSNGHMERGKQMEGEARSAYEFMRDVEVQQVGFVTNHGAGASPDGLIGNDGGVEIKTKLPHLLIEWLDRDELPPEHRAQVQGSLWVTERRWWDFVAYWPGMPMFIHRVERDEAYIKELSVEVASFNRELEKVVERLHARYGERPA